MIAAKLSTEFQRFPKDWQVLPFVDAIKDETGGNPKVKKTEFASIGCLPVVDQGQSEIAGYVDDIDLQCMIDLPCILFGDHTKVFKWIEEPFALGADGIKVLKPADEFDKRFIYHYLQQLTLPDNAGYSRHFKFLKETFIPLPPLDEQKRIAGILDQADAIQQQRQQAIDKLSSLIPAIFYDMFGDPVTNSKGLETTTIGEVCRFSSGGTPSKKVAGYWDGSFPWVSPKDMKQFTAIP